MTSENASPDNLQRTEFSRIQLTGGFILLGAFVVLRAIFARAWDRYFSGGYSSDPAFLVFLGAIFLLLSVGLVYLGFTRWVGVDLRSWWIDPQQVRGDLVWGVIGVVAVFGVTIAGVLLLTLLVPGMAPVDDTGTAPAPVVSDDEA